MQLIVATLFASDGRVDGGQWAIIITAIGTQVGIIVGLIFAHINLRQVKSTTTSTNEMVAVHTATDPKPTSTPSMDGERTTVANG